MEKKSTDSVQVKLKKNAYRESFQWNGRVLNKNTVLIIFVITIFSAISILIPHFFTLYNLVNVVLQTSSTGLLAIGVTFVLITGGIDLSLPAIMAASSVIGASVMIKSGSPIVGCCTILVVAMGIGLINGFAISKLKMVPLVVTMASMVVAGGLAIWYTQAQSITGMPQQFIDVVNGKLGFLPVPVIILIIFAFLAHMLLSKTIYGRWVYAVGINAKTAKVSGMPTTFIVGSVYLLSGFFAGMGGILLTARLGAASAGMGPDTVVLDVISSAVIGGVSIYGGAGTVLGAVFGAIFITVINNAMNLLGVPFYTTLMVKGVIIILATIMDGVRSR